MTTPVEAPLPAGPVIIYTRDGMRRGALAALPLLAGLAPFGLVVGITGQGVGMSPLEVGLMSAIVYAGASQLVALTMWTHPPDLVTVTLAAFVVNLRLALMGPVLAPWLSQVTGWRLWGGLFMVSDQNWALSVREMNNGGRDVGYLMGGGIAMWSSWTASTVVGQLVGAFVRPAPGHPLFFAALAAFVCMLTGMWRGRGDLVPWAVATCVSIGVAQLLPGTFWYIVAGALAGSITGGLRDVRR